MNWLLRKIQKKRNVFITGYAKQLVIARCRFVNIVMRQNLLSQNLLDSCMVEVGKLDEQKDSPKG